MKFLNETILYLKYNQKTTKDILWIGSKDGSYSISYEEFEKLAKNIEYDNGFGAQEIASDLVVVGEGWYLERAEYDGAEGWNFKTTPKKSQNTKSFNKMCVNEVGGEIGWKTLDKLNEELDDE